MKKILVLGYFGYKTNQLDGQTVKTRNVLQLLQSNCGLHNVTYFDTQSLRTNPFGLLTLFYRLCWCKDLIYLPAHRNLNYFFLPLFYLSKIIGYKITYIVIGGWLAEYLKNKRWIAEKLKLINHILTETSALKVRLDIEYGIKYVSILPNFRIQTNELKAPILHNSFRVVFMSRIDKMKGIDTVFQIANTMSDIQFDFYGPINPAEEGDFFEQVSNHRNTRYLGVIKPNEIIDVLKNYSVLLLPTKYNTEGFPGAVLDAYHAGLTVVVSNWIYAKEFVDDGVCGYICDANNPDDFIGRIRSLRNQELLLFTMRQKAIEKGSEYSQEIAWRILQPLIG